MVRFPLFTATHLCVSLTVTPCNCQNAFNVAGSHNTCHGHDGGVDSMAKQGRWNGGRCTIQLSQSNEVKFKIPLIFLIKMLAFNGLQVKSKCISWDLHNLRSGLYGRSRACLMLYTRSDFCYVHIQHQYAQNRFFNLSNKNKFHIQSYSKAKSNFMPILH